VLKVAHHGGATSSTPAFLAAVRPALAVVSVGARNAYGHPDPGTLARLAAAGARVYRTDRDGAILIETDGRSLSVTRWADRRVERLCLDPESVC
jgi:competence protein ComEC